MLKSSKALRIVAYTIMILCLLPLAIQTRLDYQNNTFLYLLAVVQLFFAIELLDSTPSDKRIASRHSSKAGERAGR